MRAISLHQPWASLMAWGEKRVETRSWQPPASVRAVLDLGPPGPLFAICAAKSAPAATRHVTISRPFRQVLAVHLGVTAGPGAAVDLWDKLPRGCVVAVARLALVVSTDEVHSWSMWDTGTRGKMRARGWMVGEYEVDFGDYSTGRYAWLFEDAVALPEPVPVRGYQRIWRLPPDVEAAVDAQLAKVAVSPSTTGRKDDDG